ncbi:MAG: phosphatase PAP2 family protein [Chloroflexota bacterium]
MDILVQNSIPMTAAMQGLEDWLIPIMEFFSFLGSEQFFLLVMPALYWCVDAGLGLRVGFILLLSSSLNNVFKLAFHGPRPFWVSTHVKAFAPETSFGMPSNHAQTAVGVWGTLAARPGRMWAWIAAAAVIALIGFSRVVLGVHFPQDVLAGWLIGGILLWAFQKFWRPVSARLAQMTFGAQVTLALVVSLTLILLGALTNLAWGGWVMPQEWIVNATANGGAVPDPLALSGLVSSAGALFGLAFGVSWMAARGGYSASGPGMKRALRYVVGVVGVLVFWYGLGAIFPRGEALLPYALRFIRYALVGAWIAAGAPRLFEKLQLTDKANL